MRFPTRARERATPTAAPAAPAEPPLDASRFNRLLEASHRVAAAGIGHDDIQRRADRDGISWNEALEAIDREAMQDA